MHANHYGNYSTDYGINIDDTEVTVKKIMESIQEEFLVLKLLLTFIMIYQKKIENYLLRRFIIALFQKV